jgi:hypothetical protein
MMSAREEFEKMTDISPYINTLNLMWWYCEYEA